MLVVLWMAAECFIQILRFFVILGEVLMLALTSL